MRRTIIFILTFILLSSFVFAQGAPFQTASDSTPFAIVEFPKVPYVKQNQDFTFHFHVMNSTGFLLDNTTTLCLFHFISENGTHLYDTSNVDYDASDMSFKQLLEGGNFSTLGIYSYFIQCNNTDESGFVSSTIEINHGRWDVNRGWQIPLIICILGFTFMMFYLSFKLDDEHSPLRLLFFFLGYYGVMGTLHLGKKIVEYSLLNSTEIIAYLDRLYGGMSFLLYFLLIYFIVVYVVFEKIIKKIRLKKIQQKKENENFEL